MRNDFISTVVSRKACSRSSARLRCALAATALLTSAIAYAAPLPSPPQQLTVAFTNAFPNGSVDSLTMPNANSAAIVATNPIYTGGTPQNLYTAVSWVTNPVTSTLDLIYADAEQHKIWRLPGPGYSAPSVIFSWSGKGSGPAYPVGLAADTAGNVYVISPSCAWDKPGVWVLPITSAGGYGAPILIDNTFNDPITGKPVTTLALAEVLVAGAAASPVGAAAPVWNPLDLLVLVGDTFNTRVIGYSHTQIQNVIASQSSLHGPTATIVTQAQFLTQAILKIPPVAVGMDIAQDPNTQHVTLLFSTAGGRILNFDSAKSAFITPYATNLGLGLTRLKVGTFQGSQYVFVGQLPGQILEFAAPAAGSSDTKPFASVSKGVSIPTGLAVTNSGATSAGSCLNNAAGCAVLPQLSLDITGLGTANIPKGALIVADNCATVDPRVTISNGVWSCQSEQTLDLTAACPILSSGNPNQSHVYLASNMCGKSGPTGAGISVTKITPAQAVEQNVNNTLTSFIVNPALILPANPNPACGDPNGPIIAWGPLPGIESNIVEGNTLIDVTVACVTSDPPPAGKGSHPSVVVEGVALVGSTSTNESFPAYVGGEFANLQATFNQITAGAQIVDPTGTVAPNIQGYILQSESYFAAGSYSCALNTLWTAVQYINGLANTPATAGDFVAGTPPGADQNPSGSLLMRFDHLYYDVNIVAGGPILNTDALNTPAPPACAGTTPTISNFIIVDGNDNPGYFDGTGYDLLQGTQYYLTWTTSGLATGATCSLTTTDGLFTNATEPANSVWGSSPVSFLDNNATDGAYVTATLTCGTAVSSFKYLVNPVIP